VGITKFPDFRHHCKPKATERGPGGSSRDIRQTVVIMTIYTLSSCTDVWHDVQTFFENTDTDIQSNFRYSLIEQMPINTTDTSPVFYRRACPDYSSDMEPEPSHIPIRFAVSQTRPYSGRSRGFWRSRLGDPYETSQDEEANPDSSAREAAGKARWE